jgi:hypothetical protein
MFYYEVMERTSCSPRMLTYADVCWRMLTYADVCWRMLTYADVCYRKGMERTSRCRLCSRCPPLSLAFLSSTAAGTFFLPVLFIFFPASFRCPPLNMALAVAENTQLNLQVLFFSFFFFLRVFVALLWIWLLRSLTSKACQQLVKHFSS